MAFAFLRIRIDSKPGGFDKAGSGEYNPSYHMSTESNTTPIIGHDDFVRRFSLRANNLMWLLGAGASASAGIPTACDMLWEFKQLLYISQRRGSPQAISDLSNAAIRTQLQSHIDSLGNLPKPGTPDEYAALFEAAYPSEADRRTYIDAKIVGGKPSYGHIALATLMHGKKTRIVWTTNFDALVADACAKVYDATGPLTTVDLSTTDQAEQLISEERWPIEIKLHGDFRSRRLKNTGDELRHQDTKLRQVLIDSCRRFGLVVAGYSGRDDSVMNALDNALDNPGAFPSGLFWLHHGDNPPLTRVQQLLTRASNAGVEAALVQVDNFDETMRELIRLMSDLDTKVLDTFASERKRWSSAPYPSGRLGWPVVRLNALQIELPSICRRVICGIGGYDEVREAINQAGVNILATRTRAGVLTYGTDSEVRAAFDAYAITDFDLHTIETRCLRIESGERSLLRKALTSAIVRQRGLDTVQRRNADLLTPSNPQDTTWDSLRQLVKTLSGSVTGRPELQWREGISTRLGWADNRLWLLIDPCTVFENITVDNKAAAADFARERTVKRYNRYLNDLITFWSSHLAGDGSDLRALGIGDGVDAVFRLSTDTTFSWRSGA